LIGPGGRERVVHVQNSDDLRSQWDLIALEPVGVAGPVAPLVVPADDGFQVPRKVDVRQQFDSPDWVHLHHFAFFASERPRLAKQLVGDPQLAHVVDVGAQEDGRLVLVVEPKHPGHRHRVSRHALAMTKRVTVARFD